MTQKAAEEGAFLDPIAEKPHGPLWEVFRIHTGEACFWTLADTLKEPTLERIRFPASQQPLYSFRPDGPVLHCP
jgi:hypothetical protein